MWTLRSLSQRFLARILSARASFYRALARIKAAFACIKAIVEFFALFVTALVVVFVLVYSYGEFSRDALIIDSFNVPKQFEEAGFTPDVVANRIFNTMQEINEGAQIEKGEVTWAHDQISIPDVEIPATKLGIKTLEEMARAIVPGAHKAKHVIGDIALQIGGPSSDKSQITVTIYLKDNRGSSRIRFVPKANEIDSMTREIAERIWEQAQPFVLASYLYEHHDSDESLKLARRIIAEEPPENNWVAAAYSLVGTILSDQRNYDEGFKNLNKSIELNSKSPFPYIALGNALASQGKLQCDKSAAEKKYDEAIEQYKKSPVPYSNWGNTLRYRKNYEDAEVKYRQAIKIDPKLVWAHNNLGLSFSQQGKYPDAIEEYQRANDIESCESQTVGKNADR
jgi:tetratricopeptide (TPR) repeat protein